MNPVLSVGQVKQAELRWAETNDGATWPLMVRAAQSFVRQYHRALSYGSVLIAAGVGNNGGDGYYIGKLLIQDGLSVTLVNPIGLPRPALDAYRAREEFLRAGGTETSTIPNREFSLVIDALFGSGLTRELGDEIVDFIQKLNELNVDIYAVDVPSGLNAATGNALPIAVKAKATHSFIAYKPGLLTGEGPACCGELTLDRLGVDGSLSHDAAQSLRYAPSFTRLPRREGNTHKAQHGNVRIVGGRDHMAGAAIISAQASLHAGAGRVFVHCEPSYFNAVLSRSPELMIANVLTDSALSQEIIVMGPGLGRSDSSRSIYEQVVSAKQARGVMDADALRLLAASRMTVENWILTPHESEAAALLGCSVGDVQFDRLAAAQAISTQYQTVVVLKGAGSIVATPNDTTFCHAGSPAMATPGMGDCLAGIIGSLVAQGLSLKEAAITGVNWHAMLGALLAKKQRIVLASDIIRCLKQRPNLLENGR